MLAFVKIPYWNNTSTSALNVFDVRRRYVWLSIFGELFRAVLRENSWRRKTNNSIKLKFACVKLIWQIVESLPNSWSIASEIRFFVCKLRSFRSNHPVVALPEKIPEEWSSEISSPELFLGFEVTGFELRVAKAVIYYLVYFDNNSSRQLQKKP